MDEITAVLGTVCLGVEVVHTGEESTVLSFYTEGIDDAESLRLVMEETARRHCLEPGSLSPELLPIDDGQWVTRYQAGLEPFNIGEGFLVVPAGEPVGPHRRRVIRLVPGRAFGTGEHETTRLCVEALERRVRSGDAWLDLGTGSGILAVVAYHCGARPVLALDNDPEAVEVARDVLRVNGLEGAVTLATGSCSQIDRESLDGVVANILGGYFLENSAELAGILRPGGILLAAGLAINEVEGVTYALGEAGLQVSDRRTRGDWVLLEAGKGEIGASQKDISS